MHQSTSVAVRGVWRGLLGAARPLCASASASAQSPNVRKVALDFNEIRLVGKVNKVLDMGNNWATFVLTTQRTFRRRPGSADPAAEADDAPVQSVQTERQSHLVVGRIDGDRDSRSGGAPEWQQYLYPGSRVEVFGQLAYRQVQPPPIGAEAAAAVDDATGAAAAPAPARMFEPVIRLTRFSPAEDSRGGGDVGAPAARFDRRRGGGVDDVAPTDRFDRRRGGGDDDVAPTDRFDRRRGGGVDDDRFDRRRSDGFGGDDDSGGRQRLQPPARRRGPVGGRGGQEGNPDAEF